MLCVDINVKLTVGDSVEVGVRIPAYDTVAFRFLRKVFTANCKEGRWMNVGATSTRPHESFHRVYLAYTYTVA